MDIASQAEEAEEARNFDDLPDFVESPTATAEEEALQDVVDTHKSLNNLGGVMETMMSNLHKTAKNHILACKKDFEYRCQNHDPNTGKSVGHVVPHMSEFCGPDHKALEGFNRRIFFYIEESQSRERRSHAFRSP